MLVSQMNSKCSDLNTADLEAPTVYREVAYREPNTGTI